LGATRKRGEVWSEQVEWALAPLLARRERRPRNRISSRFWSWSTATRIRGLGSSSGLLDHGDVRAAGQLVGPGSLATVGPRERMDGGTGGCAQHLNRTGLSEKSRERCGMSITVAEQERMAARLAEIRPFLDERAWRLP
jgi:hypothetical protein